MRIFLWGVPLKNQIRSDSFHSMTSFLVNIFLEVHSLESKHVCVRLCNMNIVGTHDVRPV